jgi:type I restriction enzyme M protein
MPRLSLAKLERHLYAAADRLRQEGLDAAVAEKRQQLVRFLEGLWDKYRVTLEELRSDRAQVETQLETFLIKLGYR